MSDADRIILDTLGELHAQGHSLNGYYRWCQRHFVVPLPVLIAARSGQPRGRHTSGDVRELRRPGDGDPALVTVPTGPMTMNVPGERSTMPWPARSGSARSALTLCEPRGASETLPPVVALPRRAGRRSVRS